MCVCVAYVCVYLCACVCMCGVSVCICVHVCVCVCRSGMFRGGTRLVTCNLLYFTETDAIIQQQLKQMQLHRAAEVSESACYILGIYGNAMLTIRILK